MIDPESSKEITNEIKALTPEIYKDIAKPVLNEVGNVAGRSVKALLSPIRGLLWGWEQIEKFVEDSVKKRLEQVPEENRKSPDPEIAVPLLQALTYTAQNPTLREMYINLLSNSMDSSKEKVVHPSYVGIIKQMNSLDAIVFDELSKDRGYQKVFNPKIMVKGSQQFITNTTPDWYLGWTTGTHDEFEISASLVRLSKFGLIDLLLDRSTGKGEGYEEFKNSEFLKNILTTCKHNFPNHELEIGGTKSLVFVNEYGVQFKEACK